MAYIYIIKNDINNKVYIGKTNFSIEKRWKEHLRDSNKRRCEKRPLYNALNKYGADHFTIEIVEECSAEEAADREIYWIDCYKAYTEGYNATKGGDSRYRLDYKKILKLFDTTNMTGSEIADACNCERTQVRNIIIQYRGEEARKEFTKRAKDKQERTYGKKVYCIELDEFYPSIAKAGDRMVELGKAKTRDAAKICIGRVCNGQRKSTYGMHFQFI